MPSFDKLTLLAFALVVFAALSFVLLVAPVVASPLESTPVRGALLPRAIDFSLRQTGPVAADGSFAVECHLASRFANFEVEVSVNPSDGVTLVDTELRNFLILSPGTAETFVIHARRVGSLATPSGLNVQVVATYPLVAARSFVEAAGDDVYRSPRVRSRTLSLLDRLDSEGGYRLLLDDAVLFTGATD